MEQERLIQAMQIFGVPEEFYDVAPLMAVSYTHLPGQRIVPSILRLRNYTRSPTRGEIPLSWT